MTTHHVTQVWEETFFLLVIDHEHGRLSALLYDYNTIGTDALLGRWLRANPHAWQPAALSQWPCMPLPAGWQKCRFWGAFSRI